jgi:hypothetical protein
LGLRVLEADASRQQLRVRLVVAAAEGDAGGTDTRATFEVGWFDFPMIDNTRLLAGQRCSVVLNSFSDQSADITLVLFPGTYASLKEKPYYNEVIESVLNANKKLGR